MFNKLLCLLALSFCCIGCAGGFGVNGNVGDKAPAYNCQPMQAQPTPAQPQYDYYRPAMPSVMVH